MATEASITKSITNYLATLKGCWWVKAHASTMQGRGIPDIHATYKGRSIWLEVKQPGCRPTPIQRHNLDAITTAGGIARVVTSRRDIKQIIKTIDEGTTP